MIPFFLTFHLMKWINKTCDCRFDRSTGTHFIISGRETGQIDHQSAFELKPFRHGCIMKTGCRIGGGASFIPMKVAQWHMKQKMLDFQV